MEVEIFITKALSLPTMKFTLQIQKRKLQMKYYKEIRRVAEYDC